MNTENKRKYVLNRIAGALIILRKLYCIKPKQCIYFIMSGLQHVDIFLSDLPQTVSKHTINTTGDITIIIYVIYAHIM